MNISDVTACLVTRGDLPLAAILQEIRAAGIEDVQVYDNSREPNEAVYGRYLAIARAKHAVVFTQDDDCVVPAASIRALIAARQPGEIAASMPARFWPHYPDSCLLGFGACFGRELPEQAFARFEAWRRKALRPGDRRVRPDVIFTALTPHRKLELPVEILPAASAPGRMYRQQGHSRQRQRVLEHARRARAA